MNSIIRVSAIIPCYNAAGFLSRSVRSVVAQDTYGTEIIVVDDQSTDASREVARSIADEYPNVRLLLQPLNAGPATARNTGLRHASGQYVCFLDADDEYAPGFFTTALSLLDPSPEIAWVTTGIELVNCHRPVHPVQLEAIVRSLPSNLMVRRAAADLVGGFPEHAIFRGRGAGEDIMFRTAIGRFFNGLHRPERFLRYWVTPGSHFDYFLDRSTVINGDLVFTQKSPDEESGDAAVIREQYLAQASERLSVFRSLLNQDDLASRLTDRFIESIDDYESMRSVFDTIQGSTHPVEGFALYQCARYGPACGAIVEIDSRFGRSTCWLAAGTRAAGREKVVAIDHFRGAREHRQDEQQAAETFQVARSILPDFIANLQRCGVRDCVDLRMGSSVEIGSAWKGAIRLLLLGGDHPRDDIQREIETWCRHVIGGGIVAFHDVDSSPGVMEAYREFIASSSWKEIFRIRSLRIVQRTW